MASDNLTEVEVQSYTSRTKPLLEELGFDTALAGDLKQCTALLFETGTTMQRQEKTAYQLWARIIQLRLEGDHAVEAGDACRFVGSGGTQFEGKWKEWRAKLDQIKLESERVRQKHDEAMWALLASTTAKQKLEVVLHEWRCATLRAENLSWAKSLVSRDKIQHDCGELRKQRMIELAALSRERQKEKREKLKERLRLAGDSDKDA
jgi:hypothetical protein